METDKPSVVVLAGPNGAGKSTVSRKVLSPSLGVAHFVNADVIAHGLSAFRSEEMAVKAGRIMLEHLHELSEQKVSFAFETTLASRSFAPWIGKLKERGYSFQMIFVSLPSAEMAMNRVRDRVRRGGHDVPQDTIRRRYQRGLQNFFHLYRPLADAWWFYDNSFPTRPRLVAQKVDMIETVRNRPLWLSIEEAYGQ
jgi:predicted ABC-type ATPase